VGFRGSDDCRSFWTFWLKIIFSFSLLILSGCGPSSLEDFQIEGNAICRQLVEDLKEVHSQQQLVKKIPQLRRRFNDLVDLMIQARRFQEKYPIEEISDCFDLSFIYSEQLKNCLERIYGLEGGREAIEKAQKEAVCRLDYFERKADRLP
jgi:hypothetical protein